MTRTGVRRLFDVVRAPLPRGVFAIIKIAERDALTPCREGMFLDWSEQRKPFVMEIGEFENVYREHAAAILGYARRSVGRNDVAEDIASEAFLALLRNIAKIDAAELPAWLYTVVRNRAIDYWRRHKLECEFAAGCETEARPPEPFDWSVLEASGLNAAHRLCLTLRYVHGMSREEIAGTTGLRETQVKGYLRYGLDLLRKSLVARQEAGSE